MAEVSARAVATASRVLARRAVSSEEKGSSSRTTDGERVSARARATRCCWPPESWSGRRVAVAAGRPTSSSSSSTRSPRRRAARGMPKVMLCATSRWGKSPPSCRTYPMPRRSGGTARPAPHTTRSPMVTVPASGARNPAMTRSSVVLPPPEAPRTAVVVPVGTVRSTSRRTGSAPYPTVTPRMSTVLILRSHSVGASGRSRARTRGSSWRRREQRPRSRTRRSRPRRRWPGWRSRSATAAASR